MGGTGGSQHAEVLSRARVRIRGKVQGVFFRASVADEASARGLAGWVSNLPDGSVDAVFQGQASAVDELVEWCRRGPPMARVEEINVEWEAPIPAETEFGLRW